MTTRVSDSPIINRSEKTLNKKYCPLLPTGDEFKLYVYRGTGTKENVTSAGLTESSAIEAIKKEAADPKTLITCIACRVKEVDAENVLETRLSWSRW